MTAKDFIYQAQSSRVVFAAGSFSKLGKEVEALGAKRALVVCTHQQREQVEVALQMLGKHGAGLFDKVQMYVPIEGARAARDRTCNVPATSPLQTPIGIHTLLSVRDS